MNYAYTSLPTRKWGKRMVTNWKTISVGDTINYDLASVTVLSNEIVQGVTKTGKIKRPRRIVVKLGDSNIKKEIGTESFKKGSFLKRMLKDLKQIANSVVKGSRIDYLDFIIKRYEMPLLLPEPVEEIDLCEYMNEDQLYRHFQEVFMNIESDMQDRNLHLNQMKKEMKVHYRKLSKKYHSDVNGGNDKIMTQINKAHDWVTESWNW